jgi:hypothetical protein
MIYVKIQRKRTYEGMYSIVKAALLLWVCESCEPEKDEAPENAAAGEARSRAVTRVAIDFIVVVLDIMRWISAIETEG